MNESEVLCAIIIIDTKHDEARIFKYIRGLKNVLEYVEFLELCCNEFNKTYDKKINVGYIVINKI